jgi:hypothetical protein
MELATQLLIVVGLGALELWAAIPAGLALGLHPVATGGAAAVGAFLGVLAVVSLGGPVRAWLVRRHGSKEKTGAHGLVRRAWDRHGVVGLGLLAPLLTGAPLGAALGVALGAPAGRLLWWTGLGIVLWSIALTLAATLGLAGFQALKHRAELHPHRTGMVLVTDEGRVTGTQTRCGPVSHESAAWS